MLRIYEFKQNNFHGHWTNKETGLTICTHLVYTLISQKICDLTLVEALLSIKRIGYTRCRHTEEQTSIDPKKNTIPTSNLDIAMSSLLKVKYGKNVPYYCNGPPVGDYKHHTPCLNNTDCQGTTQTWSTFDTLSLFRTLCCQLRAPPNVPCEKHRLELRPPTPNSFQAICITCVVHTDLKVSYHSMVHNPPPQPQVQVTLDIDFGLNCRSTANHYRGIDFLRRMETLDIDFGLNCRSTANHYRETHIDHHNRTHYCKTHRHMRYYYNDCIHGSRTSPSSLGSSLNSSLHASNELNISCKTHAILQIIRYTGIIEKETEEREKNPKLEKVELGKRVNCKYLDFLFIDLSDLYYPVSWEPLRPVIDSHFRCLRQLRFSVYEERVVRDGVKVTRAFQSRRNKRDGGFHLWKEAGAKTKPRHSKILALPVVGLVVYLGLPMTNVMKFDMTSTNNVPLPGSTVMWKFVAPFMDATYLEFASPTFLTVLGKDTTNAEFMST
ncbi:hypothetical protein LXL04_011518 [Taraxacum kok-saghyz]